MSGLAFSLLNSLGTGGLANLRTGGVSDLPFMVAVLRLFCLEAWDLEGTKLSTAAQAENHSKVLITFWISQSPAASYAGCCYARLVS